MTTSARDRDAAGRPRNARPRDGLGRPLPHGVTGVPTTPEDVVLPPAESLREAERLLAAGRPFHAHEVLEAAWKAAGGPERDLWQGLAQLAVGLTHARRGNSVGAARLLRRAAGRIEPYAADPPHGVAVERLAAWARAAAARIGDGAPFGERDADPGPLTGSAQLDLLRRWEDSGATWRVLGRSADAVVVALLSCDAGEEVDRLHGTDRELLAYIGERDRSS
ncbi:hypothetical protein Asp14428_08060 [Actinoplanes sp. NBRC 14428]|uniref:DUF309 family protein family protein n=1 Tax=Pseudosporangium ferrugineum TaxID=439699 RepID=A0A2T0RKE5_9ACTN|nr:DUF309 domain-containing protein [Pseudosporangium ferrugineum]PRY21592.1 hypothetical protein CLV70_11913 [Pseudosporangium ferrugineum]BCJ49331.1 hypothetical protein Asp14428_08060 [Actinoplanes sp. NBRC 14428]